MSAYFRGVAKVAAKISTGAVACVLACAVQVHAAVPPKGAQTTQATTVQSAAQARLQAQKPIFGKGAVFPVAAIDTYEERKLSDQPDGIVTLRVRNPGAEPTDPMWLKLSDHSGLMIDDAAIALPVMAPGSSQIVTVHVKAVMSGMSKNDWTKAYDLACGSDFRLLLDWRGPAVNAPTGDHQESVLKEADGRDQPGRPICDDTQCVVPCDVERNLKAALDGHVVGYGYFVGRDPGFFEGGGGKARVKADGDVPFTADTKITVASVSKLITAIAAVRLLDAKGVSLDAGIGPMLPDDFTAGSYVQHITYRQLMSQRSGVKDYGNIVQDYAALKSFYGQTVSPTGNTSCPTGPNTAPLFNPINTHDQTPCYSNYNFAIFRVLMPAINGDAQEPNPAKRPAVLSDQYTGLVQRNEFHEIGVTGTSCAPPQGDTTSAMTYLWPGSKGGYDWGDNSLSCGAAGWYVTVDEMARVMSSLVNKDGRVLKPALFETMKGSSLGFDKTQKSNADTYPEYEKNGMWSVSCNAANTVCQANSTSVAVFGPGVVGILFLNSDVSGGIENGKRAAGILEDAYYKALKPKT